MGKPVKTIVNFKTTGGLNSSEMTFNVPDAITNGTIDLEQRNYEELSLEIWTGPGSTGTQLIKDTDFSASLRNDFVSDKSGEEIYSGILIINGTYQGVDLYIPINTLDMYGDFIDKSDINRIVPDYQVYDIAGGVDQNWNLPDATLHPGEYTVERSGSGAGKVIPVTIGGQTINGLSAAIYALEGVGIITVYAYEGNWKVKAYDDFGDLAAGHWQKRIDGTLKQWGVSVVTFSNVSAATASITVKAMNDYTIAVVHANMQNTIGVAILNYRAVGASITSLNTTFVTNDSSLQTGTEDFGWSCIERWRA